MTTTGGDCIFKTCEIPVKSINEDQQQIRLRSMLRQDVSELALMHVKLISPTRFVNE